MIFKALMEDFQAELILHNGFQSADGRLSGCINSSK
jgi:hypothetical protein